MNRTLPLTLIVAVGLLVAACLLAMSASVHAQEGTEYTKSDLQDIYVSFLKSEGYMASIDGDGDVTFKREGKEYFIGVDERDPQFFRLVIPNIWPIENEAERQKVLIAAHHSTAVAKCAKVFMVKDNVWVSIEIFVNSPEDFRPLFNRSISALQTGVGSFVEKMRE